MTSGVVIVIGECVMSKAKTIFELFLSKINQAIRRSYKKSFKLNPPKK